MAAVRVAGLDGRSLMLEASVLRREGHVVEESPTGRALLEALAGSGGGLVVLGPRLPDLSLTDAIHRIRKGTGTRHVSVLALIPQGEPPEVDAQAVAAGANAVLRRPLERARLESWVAKLLAVPRRVRTRVPVQGQVVGTPRTGSAGHFVGLARNVSVNGILLASPVPLAEGSDVELELTLPGLVPMKALGRIVRGAKEIAWPYLGYGIEFLYLAPEHLDGIVELVHRENMPLAPTPKPEDGSDIRWTIRREAWVYEVLAPMAQGESWHVEIRRGARDGWRPGATGPFYVVEGASPEAALAAAKEFVHKNG
jgi:CheY-like chemotaxis protein